MIAGLVFYAVSGPGDWSWQALWSRAGSSTKKQPRSRASGARVPARQQQAAQPSRRSGVNLGLWHQRARTRRLARAKMGSDGSHVGLACDLEFKMADEGMGWIEQH